MRGQLLKVLGVAFGLAVIIGNTIIIGILRTPGEIAARLPTPGLFLSVWVVGGVYALLGALSLAEPGSMYPRSGGQYTIVRRGLGEYPAFIVGWSDWVSTSGTISAVSMVFAEYLMPLAPSLQGRNTLVSCTLTLAFGLLLWRGVKVGDMAQQILSALKALSFAAIIAACFLVPVPGGAEAAALRTAAIGFGFVGAVVLALQSVIYTYDGWTGPLYFGEEIKDPGRAVPRSMAGGVLLVLAIYLLLNVAMIRVLGVQAMAGDPFVAASAARALFGDRGDLVIRLLILLSILGGINALVLMASRVPLAMSQDGLMFRAFQEVNAGGTPTVGHWSSIGIALAFILTNTFDGVLAILAFFFVANYCFSFLSVFTLRRSDPDTPRPYRAWGFPWTTGLALLGSIAFLVGAVVADWGNSWKSLMLLGLSYPVFRLIRRGGSRAPA